MAGEQCTTGQARIFLNWQGVLNAVFKLRGEEIFLDRNSAPGLANHVPRAIAETMILCVKAVYKIQEGLGAKCNFASAAKAKDSLARTLAKIKPWARGEVRSRDRGLTTTAL